MSEVNIRGYRPEDRDAVLDLRARVFEGLVPEREIQRWVWQFEHNPFAREGVPLAWVAELEGKVIGNYGMLPLRLSLDGEHGFGLCGMDFCVDPAHRNLGLGMRLTKAFVDTPADVHLVTSPTPGAAKMMAYYGSEVLDGEAEPCLWVHAGAPPPELPMEGHVELDWPERFDDRADRLHAKIAKDRRMLITRDQHYLNWRYIDYPFAKSRIAFALGRTINLAGFSVVQPEPDTKRAHLCELYTPDDDLVALEALLRDAVEHARSEGIAELYTFQRDPEVHEILKANDFQAVQGHGMSAVCRPPQGMALKDWYLSAGDGDILFGVGR